MRPARKGPENALGVVVRGQRTDRFNEAGPQGAGKRDRARDGVCPLREASMRPARKGPENADVPLHVSTAGGRFNEAGPQGAGKRLVGAVDDRPLLPLQ